MTNNFSSRLLAALFLVSTLSATTRVQSAPQNFEPVLVIHGGAGVEKGELTEVEQEACHKSLAAALSTGYKILNNGGTALDAVEAAIKSMEDSKIFNAGAGGAFNHEGKVELDAAIMDGATRKAGAVADVIGVKNPISLALAVMNKTENVLLVGEGANIFAKEQGLTMEPPQYFFTKRRWDALQKKLKDEQTNSLAPKKSHVAASQRMGTVGAVALDHNGNLASGTSTGGLTGKRWGRVGDSPIIGAGTFAANDSCAVSCTGEGEWFIRYTVGSDLAARVRYQNKAVAEAADEIIHGVLSKEKGEGGLIALDRKGNFAMPFNSDGMFRGYIKSDGEPHTSIY